MDRANGIDFLFRLLTVLQTTENSKYFEKIKVRKNVEEINLIILALIKNSLAKTHGIQIENKNTDNKKKELSQKYSSIYLYWPIWHPLRCS